jgi:DUF4097 and DUF4098 domain-containing protein YvlB
MMKKRSLTKFSGMSVVFAALASMPARMAHAEPCDTSAEGAVSETRPAKPNGVVEIVTQEGELKVVGWNRAEVSVKGTMEGCQLDVSPSADRTRIRVNPTRRCEADLEIYVPFGSAVEVKAMTADVSVRGVSGTLKVESASGDVTISGAPSEVTARTTRGDLTVETTSGVVSARSVSGSVTVKGVHGKASVESVSGDCVLHGGDFSEAEMRSVSGEIDFEGGLVGQGSFEFKTHSGEVSLRLPAATNADFELRSFSGDLETRLGTPKTASSALDFRAGSGGAKVHVRTFSGDVRVDKK